MLDTKILHAVYIIFQNNFLLKLYCISHVIMQETSKICTFRVSGWMMEAEAKGKKQNIIEFMTRIKCCVHEKWNQKSWDVNPESHQLVGIYAMTIAASNAHFQHLTSINDFRRPKQVKRVYAFLYIAGKRSYGTSSFIIPLLMKIRRYILVIFLSIPLFLFNNETCYMYKRIPSLSKLFFTLHTTYFQWHVIEICVY